MFAVYCSDLCPTTHDLVKYEPLLVAINKMADAYEQSSDCGFGKWLCKKPVYINNKFPVQGWLELCPALVQDVTSTV